MTAAHPVSAFAPSPFSGPTARGEDSPRSVHAIRVAVFASSELDRQRWTNRLRDRGFDAMGQSPRAGARPGRRIDTALLITAEREEIPALCRRLDRRDLDCLMVLSPAPTASCRRSALMAGADDCLSLDTDPEEVVLRIRARHRWVQSVRAHTPEFTTIRHFVGWSFDIAGHILTAPNGASVQPRPASVRLLLAFLQYPRTVLDPVSILTLAGYPPTSEDIASLIRTAVYRLRADLLSIDPACDLVQTVRGEGYRLMSHTARDLQATTATRQEFLP